MWEFRPIAISDLRTLRVLRHQVSLSSQHRTFAPSEFASSQYQTFGLSEVRTIKVSHHGNTGFSKLSRVFAISESLTIRISHHRNIRLSDYQSFGPLDFRKASQEAVGCWTSYIMRSIMCRLDMDLTWKTRRGTVDTDGSIM